MPMRRRYRIGSTVTVWASTACEYALLAAWKLWGITGAANLLTAWIVIGGLLGISLLLGPPSAVSRSAGSVLGYRIALALDLGMGAALFWFGHDLLGVLWLLAALGVHVHSRRSAVLRRGVPNG